MQPDETPPPLWPEELAAGALSSASSAAMDADRVYRSYQELQSYVGWSNEDARRVHAHADLLAPHLLP